jgi:hypothetical protein
MIAQIADRIGSVNPSRWVLAFGALTFATVASAAPPALPMAAQPEAVFALGSYSSVGGGISNTASGIAAVVAGGFGNTASGYVATVGGGFGNIAAGTGSFVAGSNAQNETPDHAGVFLFADSSGYPFHSLAPNEFAARATGGVRLVLGVDATGAPAWTCAASNGNGWACSSDRNLKENLQRVDSAAILERLMAMPLYLWNAKGTDPRVRHLGPTAQDFWAAFSLGNDEKMIGMLDADGIALAAIQGLHQRLREKEREIERLTERSDRLERELRAVEAKLGL